MAVIALMSDLSNRATANSYLTLAQAEAYFGTQRDRNAFLNFDEIEMNGALVTAAQLLNTLDWNGFQEEGDFLLAFPRTMVIPPRAPGNFSGRTVRLSDEDPVPRLVVNMQAELAYHLLQNEGITQDTGGLAPGAGLSVGSIDLSRLSNPALIPTYIRTQLRQYLRTGGTNQVFVGG